MMSRFVALLCLSAAACSHESRPAESAGTEVGDTRVAATDNSPSTDPTLTPASYEGKRTERPAAAPAPRAGEVAPQPSPRTSPNNVPTSTAPSTIGTGTDSATATTEPAYQPDNTKVNERDRSSAALTPMDQGNGEADLKLTQQIRQAVMADNKLSFTAKNVKIITKDGKVTLRGPVKTADERAAIEADARKAAGTAPIDNQIEVKK
jgi:hypothetical protein